MPKTISKITPNQQKFINSYDGDIKGTAQKTNLSYGYCKQLMSLPKHRYVVNAIKERELSKPNQSILSREERQIFWSDMVQDTEEKSTDRLKASELLGRSEADFTDNLKAEASITVKVVKYGA